jgi:phenylacetate-CoA ligase
MGTNNMAFAGISRVIYAAHERALGRPTFSYLKELEESQWLPRCEIERLQMQKLKKLLQVASTHCPWHAARIKDAGIDLSDNADALTMNELRRLPTTDKQDMSVHIDQMVWRNVPGGAHQYTTGGSSGEPLIFYFGRKRQASDAAGRIRARRWWGVDFGEPEVYLWGAPVELKKTDLIKTIRDRLLNQLVLNAFDMSRVNMDEYIRAIEAFRPKCVYGYASSIALLAAHARDRNHRFSLPDLKVVCTTGEPLYPDQRSLISDVFGAPVANEYGSRDIGFTAHETPQGQMLLMSESVIVEVLDQKGMAVAPGAVGEAVMTGLCSEAQPFIRYRTGDMVRRTDELSCTGQGLHTIGEVAGRTTDFIVRADGAVMHALAAIYVLRAVDGVAEFKLIQHSVDRFEVMVAPNSRWNAEAEAQIRSGLKARLGSDVRIELRLLDSIPPDASGKHRYVVSRVPLPLGGAPVLPPPSLGERDGND